MTRLISFSLSPALSCLSFDFYSSTYLFHRTGREGGTLSCNNVPEFVKSPVSVMALHSVFKEKRFSATHSKL